MVTPVPNPAEPAGARRSVSFAAGASVFGEGDPGETLFIIEQGTVELTSGPSRRTLAELGPGDVFGELSVLEGRPRECAARAVSEVKALQLDRSALESLLAASAEVSVLMLRRLARRLHEARLGPGPAAPARRPAQEKQPATPSAPPRAGKLVHEATGTEFPLLPDARVVVGRASKGQLPGIDLSSVDTERSLSRRHAALWREGDKYFVCEEKDVPNGTFVNGRRLKPGEPVVLEDGDKVAFGLVRTVFHLA